jgi:hypothetical protein
MKKSSSGIGFHLIISSLAILCMSFIPLAAHAGTFFNCVDSMGNETLSDYPVSGKLCKEIGSFQAMSKEESDKYYQNREDRKAEERKKQKAANDAQEDKIKFDECIANARENSRRAQVAYCRYLNRPESCVLPAEVDKQMDEDLRTEGKRCQELYHQGGVNP